MDSLLKHKLGKMLLLSTEKLRLGTIYGPLIHKTGTPISIEIAPNYKIKARQISKSTYILSQNYFQLCIFTFVLKTDALWQKKFYFYILTQSHEQHYNMEPSRESEEKRK